MMKKFSNLSLSKREIIKTLLFPTAVVLISFTAVTVWAYFSSRSYLEDSIDRTTNRRITFIEELIKQQFKTFEEILRGAVGLFDTSTEVTRQDWKYFSNYFDLQQRYPGVDGFGYAKVLLPKEVSAHISRMRAQGLSNYTIQPDGNRSSYTVISYSEPSGERTDQAFGLDLSTNEVVNNALVLARDTGKPTLTTPITLQAVTEQVSQPGFLLFMPVYKKDLPTTTIVERRAAIEGYTYITMRTAEVIKSMLPADAENEVGIKIATIDNNWVLYENTTYRNHAAQPNYHAMSLLNLESTLWTIEYRFSPSIIPAAVRSRPSSTLLWGLLLSVLIAFVVLRLLLNRSRKLVQANERAVELAKDDLLSLASHQLRTPATGVKQYIAMLIDGYAGSLNADQKKFLQKAYQSNERQLHIINELLMVAKADEGRIVLSLQPINLNKLIREVVNEQMSTIKEMKHTVVLKMPRKAIMIDADAHSLRMTLDNLLTNATKYMHKKGKIMIDIQEQGKEVMIGVHDQGIGINKDELHLLFKQFSRIPNELSTHTSGSGIGLYLAQHLIQLHNGTINVRSEPGVGSSFIIRLPRKQSKLSKVKSKKQ